MIERYRFAFLSAIVAIALAAAGVWALRVPLLGAPDENTHVDYAMAIWSNGGPIAASRHPLHIDVHPYTHFFERVGWLDTTRFDDGGRVPPGYGTAAYFADADRAAPAIPPDWWQSAHGTPYIAASYPFGFYGLQALVFELAMALTRAPIESLFAMRFADVALLGLTLVTNFGTLREMRVKPALALALVAAIGWLPTMQAVFAGVQPDALADTLVAISLLLAMRVRTRGASVGRTLALGAVFALFAIVKVHIFAAIAIAVVPLYVARLSRERLGAQAIAARAAVLALPPLATDLLSQRLLAHTPSGLAYSSFAGRLALLRTDPAAYLGEAARVAFDVLRSVYGVAGAGLAYYHDFSALHTPVFTGVALTAADLVLANGTLIVLGLMLLRFAGNVRRLTCVARARGAGAAARLVAGDVVFNAYVVYLGVLILAEIYVDEVVSFESRYLLTLSLGAVAIAAVYMPRLLRRRRARERAALAVATGLAAYAAVAMLCGFHALQARYYDGPDRSAETREYAVYLRHFAPRGTGNDVRTVSQGAIVEASGYAFDSHRTAPTTVRALLDGRVELPVRNGLASYDEAYDIGDERLLLGGFSLEIATAALAPGPHALTFSAAEPGGVVPATRPPLVFTVVARARRPGEASAYRVPAPGRVPRHRERSTS